MSKKFGTQTFLVILVEAMAMDDGIAPYRVREVGLVILVARKLGPPWRTFGSIVACVRAVMPIQCCHCILHHLGQRSSGFDDISSHGAHREVIVTR